MFWLEFVRFCYWLLSMAFAWRIDSKARIRIESLRSTENFCKHFLTSWQICNVVKTLTVIRYCLIRWRILDGVIRTGFIIREWNIPIYLYIATFKKKLYAHTAVYPYSSWCLLTLQEFNLTCCLNHDCTPPPTCCQWFTVNIHSIYRSHFQTWSGYSPAISVSYGKNSALVVPNLVPTRRVFVAKVLI